MLKGTTNQSIILHSVKICFNNKGKVNLGARRWKECISSRLTRKGMLEEILQVEEEYVRKKYGSNQKNE